MGIDFLVLFGSIVVDTIDIVGMGKMATQLIPKERVHIYRLGGGLPPHTRPNEPTHTQPKS
jgi:hypothetical protein